MSGFVDEAQLHAKAGDGGAGAVAFRREAHVDRGGPDGGDGGRGGDVWLVASRNQASLLGFRDHPFRRAVNGGHGGGKKKHGARGADLVVPVPVGTVLRRGEEVVCDLSTEGERWLAAMGGRGGRGNASFLSNRRRAPAFAEQAELGEEHWFDLELKLAADVALVGMPNAGKSTLISTVSAAKPKIANYPFTTLQPHLGVVRVGSGEDETEFVLADIPGLVEGAAEGRGLGHRFLRHIERAKVLVVLIDLSAYDGTSPADQYAILLGELERYDPDLIERPRLVVGSKCDVVSSDDSLTYDHVISAATGEGVHLVMGHLSQLVREARDAQPPAPAAVVHRPLPEGLSVERIGHGRFALLGKPAERAVAFSDLTDDGALAEVLSRLKRLGVDRALARAGAHDGDEVVVGELSFSWYREGPPGFGEDESDRPRRRRSRL